MSRERPISTLDRIEASGVKPEPTAPERMTCMEIWGGNRAINKRFEAPGLDIYVHSAPYKESKTGGGDIYYVTSCASGRISRLLLADVSGHGADVSDIAITLRDLLRENVNKISQEKFVSQRPFLRVAPVGRKNYSCVNHQNPTCRLAENQGQRKRFTRSYSNAAKLTAVISRAL